jgi:flagellar basal body-associated protein FliL
LPNWLLVCLLIVVVVVILAMFALTFYNLSAPRSTLRNLLGLKPRLPFRSKAQAGNAPAGITTLLQHADQKQVSQHLLSTLSLSARVGKRTTRTTLAITGFALLGLTLIALFGLSSSDVHDLRTQVVASLTTLVATIAGFYFGSQGSSASGASGGTAPAQAKTSTQRKITDVVPSTGPGTGGDHVAIIGTGLSTVSQVTVGAADAATVQVIGDTALRIVTPSAPTPGPVDITVVFADGSQIVRASGFTYT